MKKLASGTPFSQRFFNLSQDCYHILLPGDHGPILPPCRSCPARSSVHVSDMVWPPCPFHCSGSKGHSATTPYVQQHCFQVLNHTQTALISFWLFAANKFAFEADSVCHFCIQGSWEATKALTTTGRNCSRQVFCHDAFKADMYWAWTTSASSRTSLAFRRNCLYWPALPRAFMRAWLCTNKRTILFSWHENNKTADHRLNLKPCPRYILYAKPP